MKKFIFITALLILFSPKAYAFEISAKCAVVTNAVTGEIIYEKNARERHGMASTTKIMTALIATERSDPEDIVTISEIAQEQEGSSIYLRCGNQIKMKDLLYGMMLNSGNDAACAVAEHISGSMEEFSKEMNKRAKDIGAFDTSFENANGLDDKNHYSTAYDMALIAAEALKNDFFCEIVSAKNKQITVGNDICYLKNHNKLLWNYDGCIGVKTGYTKNTGRCLVSAAERDGIKLIAVTLDAPDDWNDHKKMLDHGFENTYIKTAVKKGTRLKKFNDGKLDFGAITAEDINIPVIKNRENKTEIKVHTINKPKSNISKGEKIGYCEYSANKKVIGYVDLISDSEVIIKNRAKKNEFSLILSKILKMLLINP